ncbi:anti-phage deoxyguanosine triphosphatase [Allopusillimonas ginsengisoli]|uniref:anti-phage deoxyguanosine triphosphatase n=1 Tax=Allopusillimonas ginsengisoli TaxID=453575 RepID=UPI00101EB3D8|nr:anti-phage deoxyguanosine triphosphatase [Allopusillimonas ginsengisoli]TEA70322.1 deoxyguanosinetriphosphate triphosphohydrolase family protein [Allopusillimonas ginsengisoli]
MNKKIWEERRLPSKLRDRDVRSEWERDYARLIHSAAFRRLQSKTQVLGLGESDFYRTRLTHSMEVAQIGVGIVRWLKKKHKDNAEIQSALPEDALISSICLAHDIGHPPFGHGGEIALNICMRQYGGFEGNGQTLRILSRLDKYTDQYGLNPTRRLILGVLKYPASYSATVVDSSYGDINTFKWLSKADDHKPPKCYLDDERDVVNWLLETLDPETKSAFISVEHKFDQSTQKRIHNKPIHKALDTSIMELADDISYSLHDLEDAVSLGMVTRKGWEKHNEGAVDLFKNCGIDYHALSEELFGDESYLRKNAIGGLVNKFITNAVVRPSAMPHSKCELIKWNAYIDKKHEGLLGHIFNLVRDQVIKSCNVQQLEFKGQKLVIELFDALISDPERLLPGSTLKRYAAAEGVQQKQARVICDFIAGMTDEYATRLYEKLFYPHKGSIFDKY